MNKKEKIDFYEELSSFRSQDEYCSNELKYELISTFFPSTNIEIISDLSNVTSAFYGLALQEAGKLFGNEYINKLSENIFYELGKIKTQQAISIKHDIPRDTRGVATVLVSAVYNASPEYSISVEEISPEYTRVTTNGVDRYHRITKMFGINEYLSWPTLLPFILGIKDQLGIDITVKSKLAAFKEASDTSCTYEFIINKK